MIINFIRNKIFKINFVYLNKIKVMKKLIIILFVTPLLGQNIPTYTPPNGLDLWYSFSNNTIDESGNNHNGVPHNLTPTTGRSGQPNTAYQFNGTNSKIKINNPILGGQSVDEFAFFFLFRLDSLTSSNYAQTLWRKEYPNFDLQIEINISGQLILEYQSPDTVSIIYPSNFTFQIGQWYDLVINFFDSQAEFYINGSPVPVSVFAVPFYSSWPMSTTDVANQCNFIQNSSGVNIGKGINYHFKGAIDEVGVWNRPLIECEIQSLHLSELQCPVSSPCTEIIYDTVIIYDTLYALETFYDTITVYDTITTTIYDTLFIATHQDESIFYVPNTFTPDDNEHNQTWGPVALNGFTPYMFELFIFNRWGELMYQSNDISSRWDGTFNGMKCFDGTYSWRINYKFNQTDSRSTVVGNVNLLR
jgi:gliding motility-associated-like protein